MGSSMPMPIWPNTQMSLNRAWIRCATMFCTEWRKVASPTARSDRRQQSAFGGRRRPAQTLAVGRMISKRAVQIHGVVDVIIGGHPSLVDDERLVAELAHHFDAVRC